MLWMFLEERSARWASTATLASNAGAPVEDVDEVELVVELDMLVVALVSAKDLLVTVFEAELFWVEIGAADEETDVELLWAG